MKRTAPTIILVAVLVLATVQIAPTLAAAAPVPAEGEWTWVNETFREKVHLNGGAFLRGDEAGTWTGTFEGGSHDRFVGIVSATGELHGTVWAEFENVSVNGAVGGLRMRFTWHADDSYFGGRWTILSGSGGLRHLRGTGQWHWSDDVGVEGGALYSGTVWEQ